MQPHRGGGEIDHGRLISISPKAAWSASFPQCLGDETIEHGNSISLGSDTNEKARVATYRIISRQAKPVDGGAMPSIGRAVRRQERHPQKDFTRPGIF
jgi:hypothetical protein